MPIATALEVLVFPEAMRGSHEGPLSVGPAAREHDDQRHRGDGRRAPRRPDAEARVQGRRHADHQGEAGYADRHLPPGEQSDAKVGAKVFVGATKGADGSLTAARIAVGKDGLTPPM